MPLQAWRIGGINGGAVEYQPLNDWLAVVSGGVFPTPTPTSAARAYFAATQGLRHTL